MSFHTHTSRSSLSIPFPSPTCLTACLPGFIPSRPFPPLPTTRTTSSVPHLTLNGSLPYTPTQFPLAPHPHLPLHLHHHHRHHFPPSLPLPTKFPAFTHGNYYYRTKEEPREGPRRDQGGPPGEGPRRDQGGASRGAHIKSSRGAGDSGGKELGSVALAAPSQCLLHQSFHLLLLDLHLFQILPRKQHLRRFKAPSASNAYSSILLMPASFGHYMQLCSGILENSTCAGSNPCQPRVPTLQSS